MKKIFLVLAAISLMAGCDDGDMTFKTFDFGDAQAQQCSNGDLLYKKQGSEVLILDVNPDYFANIASEIGDDGLPVPTIIHLTTSDRIIYRNYSDDVSSGNILCSDVPPASPSVVEEWIGQGTISVTTTTHNDEDGHLIGYDHVIKLVDVSFNQNGETVRILDNNFGTFRTSLGYDFSFGNEGDETPIYVEHCDNGKVFIKNSTNALVLNIDSSYFSDTTDGHVATLDLSDTGNADAVKLFVYDGAISTNDLICSQTEVVSPALESVWVADSGTLQITTVYNDVTSLYSYEIRLYDTNFYNASGNENEHFSPESNTEAGNYFYFGTYTPTP